MNTTTFFLFFVFACLGFAAGAIVTGARQRTQPPLTGDQPPAPEGSIEVLRLWRSTDGQLRLGMDGQQLPGPNALQPEQRRRLIKLVIDLRPWLEAPSEAQTAPAAPAVAAAPVVPAVSAAPAAALQTAPAPSRPAKEKVAPPVIKSIIEQIEDVLQAKLAGSALEKREIHLTEGPEGAVIVKVGLNKYDGIEAVPEPEIQALIRQAVGDWEKGTR
ncbi:MAG: hypothetical protein ABSB41_08215 [Anaerolineales bacterium]